MSNPNYDPSTDRTRHAAVSPSACDEMAQKHGWKQSRNRAERYEPTENKILAVNCVFAGDCEFPKTWIDLTQGDSDDD